MTQDLKFSNLWENLKLFLNKTKIAERELHKKVLDGANHESMQSKEFQELYVNTAIAAFRKNPKLFSYTDADVAQIREMIKAQGPEKFAISVMSRLQGQFNQNGTFFGEQAKFKWRRSTPQSGLAAVASSNTTRPWLCSLVHLPGHYIQKEDGLKIGGLFNHNWGFVDAKDEWYATYFAKGEPLKLIKTWELDCVAQAQKHFEKLYLNIVFTDRHPEFKKRVFENNSEIASLTI